VVAKEENLFTPALALTSKAAHVHSQGRR